MFVWKTRLCCSYDPEQDSDWFLLSQANLGYTNGCLVEEFRKLYRKNHTNAYPGTLRIQAPIY